jgi:hypothetical protein
VKENDETPFPGGVKIAGPGDMILPTAASIKDHVSTTSKAAGWPVTVPLTVIVSGPDGERPTDSPGIVTK